MENPAIGDGDKRVSMEEIIATMLNGVVDCVGVGLGGGETESSVLERDANQRLLDVGGMDNRGTERTTKSSVLDAVGGRATNSSVRVGDANPRVFGVAGVDGRATDPFL